MFYNFIRKVHSYWRTDIENGYWKVPFNITNPSPVHTRVKNNIKNNDMITNIFLVGHHEYSSFLHNSRAQSEATPILYVINISHIIVFRHYYFDRSYNIGGPARTALAGHSSTTRRRGESIILFSKYIFYNNSKTSVARV